MKEDLRKKTDEELEEMLANIPKPYIIKKLEEATFKGKVSIRPVADELVSRIETYDNVSTFIQQATAKALLEEDKMLLIYGTCYTAILYVKSDKKDVVGMEFVVSFEDPRKNPDYKDRIMTLRRSTVRQGNRIKEERIK
jgi:hypothetical protein